MSHLDEDALRALVRAAVRRHLPVPEPLPDEGMAVQPVAMHASHGRYALPDSDGPCLIEPTVSCTHCGYCQSHGH